MKSEVAELAAELVRIKSVNPMDGDASREGCNEAAMARAVAGHLRTMGLAPQIQEVAPHRLNVYTRTPSSSGGPPVLFESHMDTVPADNWPEAWSPEVRGGRLYGRGACDTKGSAAAMLVALKRVLSRGVPRRGVLFLATCDEESGAVNGASAWAALGLEAAFGVVGEPTKLEIVRAHKGAARWTLRTRGRSAHTAHPERGVNAIVRMSKAVLCLERLHQDVLRKRSHPLLGTATLSVGTIEGGRAPNVVPDECRIRVDRRLLPGETGEQAWQEIERALTEDPAVEFEVEMVGQDAELPGLDTPEDSPAVQEAIRACRAVLGEAKVGGVSYGTDASVFARAGIPCIVLGPGDIKDAHIDDESVSVEELEKAADIYERIMGD